MKTKTQKKVEQLEQTISSMQTSMDLIKSELNLITLKKHPKLQEDIDVTGAVYFHYDNALEVGGLYMVEYNYQMEYFPYDYIPVTKLMRWSGGVFYDHDSLKNKITHDKVLKISEKVELPEPV